MLVYPKRRFTQLRLGGKASFFRRKKAALFYVEKLSNLNQDGIQKAYDGLNENGFTKADQEELTNCVILMEVWSRVFLAQGKTSYKK